MPPTLSSGADRDRGGETMDKKKKRKPSAKRTGRASAARKLTRKGKRKKTAASKKVVRRKPAASKAKRKVPRPLMPVAKAAHTGSERAVPAGGPSRTREGLAGDGRPGEMEEDQAEEAPVAHEEADADVFETRE